MFSVFFSIFNFTIKYHIKFTLEVSKSFATGMQKTVMTDVLNMSQYITASAKLKHSSPDSEDQSPQLERSRVDSGQAC